jgi:ABC-2 type transport system permease protein
MSVLATLIAREVKHTFASPRSYLLLSLFSLASGLICFDQLRIFNELIFLHMSQTMGGFDLGTLPNALNMRTQFFLPLMDNLALALVAILPLSTMHVFSEDSANNTDQLLAMTGAPPMHIVISKFVACGILVSVAIAAAFLYPLTSLGHIGYGEDQLTGAFTGLWLHALALGSIGLAASAFTRSQVIAAVTTWAIGLAIWDLSWLGSLMPGAAAFLEMSSLQQHFIDFSDGFINSRSVLFFLTFILFGACLARLALALRRITG